MRFVLVSDYSFAFVGGAQTAFLGAASELAAAGHEVHVIVPDYPTEATGQAGNGPQVHIVRPRFRVPGLKFPVYVNTKKLRSRVRAILQNIGGADIVIVHSEFGLANAALSAAKQASISCANTVHTFFWRVPTVPVPTGLIRRVMNYLTGRDVTVVDFHINGISNLMRSVTLATCIAADFTLSPSKHQGKALVAAGAKHTFALPNITNFETNSDTARKSPKRAPGAPLEVLWVGRAAPEKNLPLALAAVQIANDKLDANVHLRVVGDPKLKSSKYVTSMGKLPHGDLPKLYAEADCTAITSFGFDNLPMVAIEGFAFGKPVVLVDPKLGDDFGDAALVATQNTSQALAEVLATASKNSDVLKRATAGAIDYSKQTTATAYAARIHDILSSIKHV